MKTSIDLSERLPMRLVCFIGCQIPFAEQVRNLKISKQQKHFESKMMMGTMRSHCCKESLPTTFSAGFLTSAALCGNALPPQCSCDGREFYTEDLVTERLPSRLRKLFYSL